MTFNLSPVCYRKSYNLTIHDREQPLLLHRPKKQAPRPGVSDFTGLVLVSFFHDFLSLRKTKEGISVISCTCTDSLKKNVSQNTI